MSQNTIGYYINQLPDGIREKALANIEKQIGLGYLEFSHPRLTSVSIAVKGAFNWGRTPEGEEFWFEVCRTSPGYEAPRPVHPLMAILGAFAEMLEELESDKEAAQENSQTSNVRTQEDSQTPTSGTQEDSQTNVGTKNIPESKPKSVTAAVRKVLTELGINMNNHTVFSDGRKQGVSVKVCNLYLKDETRQKVREKMEALGYTYHRINEPSGNASSTYYRGAFKGTRFHFS